MFVRPRPLYRDDARMLDLTRCDVVKHPFPHAVVDDFLDIAWYAALRESFPECPRNSGPTGYSCFVGDVAYETLIASCSPWRHLHEATQSDSFVTGLLDLFPNIFARQARVDLSRARFTSYLETRDDKEKRHLPDARLPADALFVRCDLLQGNVGYRRAPHLDHRRRAATMLIYFCDSEDDRMSGGDLVLHDRWRRPAKTIRPRHNRMVVFPCHNRSLHSVSPIIAQQNPRSFVQIALSSTLDLWPPTTRARLTESVEKLRLGARAIVRA